MLKRKFSYYNMKKCCFGTFFRLFIGKNAKAAICYEKNAVLAPFFSFLYEKKAEIVMLHTIIWKKCRFGAFFFVFYESVETVMYHIIIWKKCRFGTFFSFFLWKKRLNDDFDMPYKKSMYGNGTSCIRYVYVFANSVPQFRIFFKDSFFPIFLKKMMIRNFKKNVTIICKMYTEF